jgi:hypothetical protein
MNVQTHASATVRPSSFAIVEYVTVREMCATATALLR